VQWLEKMLQKISGAVGKLGKEHGGCGIVA